MDTVVPALIVVDMQEDFCPPNGTLAVREGRTLAPLINTLLASPSFTIRIATQDFHPPDHISFATNHPPPGNIPFESTVQMKNPRGTNPKTKAQRLWPVHCVAGTSGSDLIPEIETSHVDVLVKKGMQTDVEMYSAFGDAFGNLDVGETEREGGSGSVDVDVTALLKSQHVTDVFVVGLAGEFCVKCTAVDAAKAGFRVWVVSEGTRCVDPGVGWEDARGEMERAGVRVVGCDAVEVRRVLGEG